MTDESRRERAEGSDAAIRAQAFAKAVDLLAVRAHFTAELVTKLERRHFEHGVVEATISRLTELGYLDDLAAARGFSQQRAVRQGWGPRRLASELARRRVADEVAATVIDELFAEGEAPAARAAAERWRAKGGNDGDRLARYLDRRGFSKSVIVEILQEFAAEAGSGHEEF